ncbi:MAG: multiheme C-type cytochrome [Desulfobulbaceae bacterium]|uniref:Multiheme C-type cytochrome n=1 Tax=Candidatus Desulfobia pelagia TaxID=2841692 RepID=A0A8J6TF68_9BACT|nr:multiheme C-type cytochrome [Candidatus Desulfobia pelagia]
MSVLLVVTVAHVSGAGPILFGSAAAKDGGHPQLTEQEKLRPCSECHQIETPEIYDEWYNSRHGLGMVKCYQCHGTYENMLTVPEKSTCGFCHNGALEKCPADKPCWQCHAVHTFKVKK